MNNNIRIYDGQTVVCDCGPNQTPPAIPINSAAGLAMGSTTPPPMIQTPPTMVRLSSGHDVPVLKRQSSSDSIATREQKLLSWIKSKSAWASKCRIGAHDKLRKLQETMISDFKEWKLLFSEGGEPKEYIVTKKLPNFHGGDDFTLTSDHRQKYCKILDTQLLLSKSDDYTIEYTGKDDANNSFIHCGFPPLPPLLAPNPNVTMEEVKQSREDRMVLLVARDEYREWWINKHTSQVEEDGYATSNQDEDLKLYWNLLQGQNCSHTGSFDDFFLLERGVENAIKLLEGQPSHQLTTAMLTELERQTSISGLIAILINNEDKDNVDEANKDEDTADEANSETKRGGRRKRKSKKRTRKKRGGRKSRRKRGGRKSHRRKTKRRKRKTRRRRK